MSQHKKLEDLEAVLATQDLLAFEGTDISEYIGDKCDEISRFQKPSTTNEIEPREEKGFQRKRDKVRPGQ